MAYVVTRPCIGTKDRSCVEVCPVDCFYNFRSSDLNTKYNTPAKKRQNKKGIEEDDIGMLIINPDECISCGACETECPVEAIFEDSSVPDSSKEFIQLNEQVAAKFSEEELQEFRVTSK